MLTRKDTILKLIVEYVVKNAQPVGSKTLIEEYGLQYSSATIRAEMNQLENEGYLEKTHTSSGRVPSTKGYEYYVSNLRDKTLNGDIKYRLQTVLTERVKSIEEILKESCEILSDMTSLVSVVLGTNTTEEKLASIQIIPLSDKTASAVFVTDKGYVENKTFVIEKENAIQSISEVVKILNDRLVGTPISELVTKMSAIKPLVNDYLIDNDMVYQMIMEIFLKITRDRMSLYGKEELLEQPEFQEDAKKLKRLMKILDNPNALGKYLNSQEGRVSVKFLNKEDDLAVVSARVEMPGNNVGNIALVGPTRMDYDTVVASLEYVVSELEKYFGKGGK